MKYIPCTKDEELEILDSIGIKDFNDLLKNIPKKLRLSKNSYPINSLSELELINHMNNLSKKNNVGISFMGAGSYDRYIPSIVDFVLPTSLAI